MQQEEGHDEMTLKNNCPDNSCGKSEEDSSGKEEGAENHKDVHDPEAFAVDKFCVG